MFNNWFSKKEQSTALSLLLSGTCLGLVVNVPITLFINDLAIKNGWSLLFYGGSLIHIIWLVLWLFLVSDIPERHKFIQDKEIFYIRQNSSNILELVFKAFVGEQWFVKFAFSLNLELKKSTLAQNTSNKSFICIDSSQNMLVIQSCRCDWQWTILFKPNSRLWHVPGFYEHSCRVPDYFWSVFGLRPSISCISQTFILFKHKNP